MRCSTGEADTVPVSATGVGARRAPQEWGRGLWGGWSAPLLLASTTVRRDAAPDAEAGES